MIEVEPLEQGRKVATFDSVQELLHHAMHGEHLGYNSEAFNHLLTDGPDSWYNRQSTQDVKRYLSQDTPHYLMDSINKIRKEIESDIPPPQRRRRKRRANREAGEELNADAVVQRRTDAWDLVHREMRDTQVARILVDSTVMSHRYPEELLYRGAAAAVIADHMEERGVRCEVVCACVVKRPSSKTHWIQTEVVVKHSDAPLDLCNLAYTVGEIAFFRRIMITAFMKLSEGKAFSGCGRLGELRQITKADFIVPSHVFTLEETIRIIKRFCL